MPYGLPSGANLLTQARALCQNDPDTKPLSEFGPVTESTRSDFLKLRNALNDTLDVSLDAVLEHRADIMRLGKVLMAHLLLKAEREALKHTRDTSHDWMPLLFKEMTRAAPTLDQFVKNSVAFVTFNYDRLLEYKLMRGMAEKYGRPLPVCADALKQIPIVHVHGYLGDLPEFQPEYDVPFGGVNGAVGTAANTFRLRCTSIASEKIIVIHEGHADTPEFKRAVSVLREAHQIVFLGFGYNETNLLRLNPRAWPSTEVFGTAYGTTESERRYEVTHFFQQFQKVVSLGNEHWDCLTYLRNSYHLFRG